MPIRYDGDLKGGHTDPPTVTGGKGKPKAQPSPYSDKGSRANPYKGESATVEANKEKITPVKTGAGTEIDISPGSTQKHPVDFYQNQGDAGSRGEEIPFRTDIGNRDDIWNKKDQYGGIPSSGLKPEFQNEINKLQKLTDEPPKLQQKAKEETLNMKGPAESDNGGSGSSDDDEDDFTYRSIKK